MIEPAICPGICIHTHTYTIHTCNDLPLLPTQKDHSFVEPSIQIAITNGQCFRYIRGGEIRIRIRINIDIHLSLYVLIHSQYFYSMLFMLSCSLNTRQPVSSCRRIHSLAMIAMIAMTICLHDAREQRLIYFH